MSRERKGKEGANRILELFGGLSPENQVLFVHQFTQVGPKPSFYPELPIRVEIHKMWLAGQLPESRFSGETITYLSSLDPLCSAAWSRDENKRLPPERAEVAFGAIVGELDGGEVVINYSDGVKVTFPGEKVLKQMEEDLRTRYS